MKGVKKARCFSTQKTDQKEASKEMNEEKEKEKLSTQTTYLKSFSKFPQTPLFSKLLCNTNNSLLAKAPLQ